MTKQDKIKKVMDEFKRGNLKTPNGRVVKSRKQALAIAISESEDYAEKGDLINHLSINSTDDALDVLKSAGTEDIFEKAKHQVGDPYPGKPHIVWTDLGNGKFDWKSTRGKWHKGNGGASTATATTPKTKSTPPKTDKERLDLQQEYSTMSQLIKKPSTSAQRKKEFQDRMKEIEGMGLQVVKGRFQWSDTGKAVIPNTVKETQETKQKKLRPVGTGTNGPERRTKEEQEKIDKKKEQKKKSSKEKFKSIAVEDFNQPKKQRNMKTAISKIDGKKYFKTVAKFSGNANEDNAFIEGENYWVRNADESDNVDANMYCVVKGTFNNHRDALSHTLNRNSINRYNGTYHFKMIILKSKAKDVLNYCD